MIYCYHGHNQPLGCITIDSLSVYFTNSCFEYKSRISVVEFVLYSCSESIEPAYYIIYLIGIDKMVASAFLAIAFLLFPPLMRAS